MRILFLGDSITDMRRTRDNGDPWQYGFGYPAFVQGTLGNEYPNKYTVINRGISGSRTVDIFSRIRFDCWQQNPDVITLLIGINDVWLEGTEKNGVDLKHYEKYLRLILTQTQKRFPNAKYILMEPFVLEGKLSNNFPEGFEIIKGYQETIRKIAEEFGCEFIPLQQTFTELAEKYDPKHWLIDGVHTTCAGAKIIADKWLKLFKEKIIKE